MRASLTLEQGFAAPNQMDLDRARSVRLGRNRTNDIVLHDQHASRFHAELFFDNNGWVLRDLETTNGTKVNGVRITDPVVIKHGESISVGEVRLRFFCVGSLVDSDAETPLRELPESIPPSDQTSFEADELTALVGFLNEAAGETTVNGLVRLATETIYRQIHPKAVGYLSLDRKEPLWRWVLPKDASIDPLLLDTVGDPVKAQRQALWARSSRVNLRDYIDFSQFSGNYQDALCIPLLGQDTAATVLGLLYLFHFRELRERQVHFCKVLADCMGNNLRVMRVRRSLEADLLRLRGIRMGARTEDIIGSSSQLSTLRDQITKLSESSSPILLHGPTGSGKELVALALHRSSRRRAGPFVEVNCASVPRELAESQFFGHVKGAFTGANNDRAGHFQQADEGVLFLDEVADLHLDVQAKLLRGFEGHGHRVRIVPVGSQDPIQVSVRIIAATHRNLSQLVAEKRFREDLYFRLAMTTIEVPALKEHPEDIPTLVLHFLGKLNPEYHRHTDAVTISPEAIARLAAYDWPGNVRQLRAVLEQAVAMCDPGEEIQAHELNIPMPIRSVVPDANPLLPTLNVSELEAIAIREAIRTTNTQMQAAAILGMHRDTLRTKLAQLQKQAKEGAEGPS